MKRRKPKRARKRWVHHILRRVFKGFTLIEVLIALGIVIMLASVAVLTLNPTEFRYRARDAQRLTEVNEVSKTINRYLTHNDRASIGSTTVMYVSLPDTSPTCANLGLPLLPVPWTYHCASSSTLRNTDGTGWMPINFTDVPAATLSLLPVDPANVSSSGNFYHYCVGAGSKWEINTILESGRYSFGGPEDKGIKDGGALPEVYEVGSGVGCSPIDYYQNLLWYWPFNEGSGASTTDAGGENADGTLLNGPTWQSASSCRAGNSCLVFNGVNQNVNIPNHVHYDTDYTLFVWTKTTSMLGTLLGHGGYSDLRIQNGFAEFSLRGDLDSTSTVLRGNIPVNDNVWHKIVGVRQGNNMLLYVDGILDATTTFPGGPASTMSVEAIGSRTASGTHASFAGTIDEVRVYVEALDQATIQNLP